MPVEAMSTHGPVISVRISPARRVGRRRCSRLRLRRRAMPTPSAPSTLPSPVWCPQNSFMWNAIPHLIKAHVEFCYGGKTTPAPARMANPPLKIKAKFEGRIWTVDAPDGSVWRDIQWAYAAEFHMGAADFIMQYARQEVNLADALPVANQHGRIIRAFTSRSTNWNGSPAADRNLA